MDPDAALTDLLNAIRDFQSARQFWTTRDDLLAACHEADTVVERFEALDEWLRKGGARPRAWGYR